VGDDIVVLEPPEPIGTLERKLEARTRELAEARKYQAATGEVLKVISQSSFDLHSVLQTLAGSAARLCGAGYCAVFRRDGEVYRMAAVVAFSPETESAARQFQAFLEMHPIVPGRGSMTGRVALERRAVQVADTANDPEYTLTEAITLANLRTQLGVPLLREGSPIGVIVLGRQHVEPFTDSQVELVTTFADQAVIAIENARLFDELRERTRDLQHSLEYQSATSEVLKVMSRSTFDLDPVLRSVVETAARLCKAEMAFIMRRDGELYRAAIAVGFSAEYQAFMKAHPIRPDRGSVTGRVVLERRTVQIADVANDPEYTLIEATTTGGQRTALGVPLLRDNEPIGVIFLSRARVQPFSEKQIELVTTFADQAVIAIENVRLFEELRERTEELAQRQAELRVTFDNMGEGVVMFDDQLRLAAWNRNLQLLLDLPDSFFSRPQRYPDYIRYLVERGEFGQVDGEAELKRYTQNAGRQRTLERSRPDGRVLEVRHNPVGGGGFVLIYSDITERKHAEAKILTARDAAESALRDLKALQASLIHAEKMASLGQLTAGIAHEIKNPLNFVNNFAGLSGELLEELKEMVTPAAAALAKTQRAELDNVLGTLSGNLQKIAEHGRRADGIVKSMLAHSRGGTGERRNTDINGLVDESLSLAYHGARAQDQAFSITLERDLDQSIAPISLFPQDITRALLNLFGNAFYAARKRQRDVGSDFQPILRVTTRELRGRVEVRVRDNGIGIPPEVRGKLFQPFFTTKPTGEGTGLGLSISYDIVTQQHGGTIDVESRVAEFTEFIITLPRSPPPLA